jgi:beta-lactamase class A
VRDLGKGQWVGINQNDHFSPASLIKVPMMIAVLKIYEENPSLLEKKIFYPGGTDYNKLETIKPISPIEAGHSYSVNQLLEAMIVDSDNNATFLLGQQIDRDQLFEIFTDLGIPVPPSDTSLDYLSPKAFASFFRVLYNATYLQRETSEKAMRLLLRSNFAHGIRAAIPEHISIAEKFGERTLTDANGRPIKKELHDCGIVYYPNRPVLMCIMTSGYELESLQAVIQSITTTIYESFEE